MPGPLGRDPDAMLEIASPAAPPHPAANRIATTHDANHTLVFTVMVIILLSSGSVRSQGPAAV